MRGHFGAFMLGRAAAVSEGARYFESLIIFARLRAEKAPARFQVDRFRADVVKPVNDLLIRETANLRCRVWSAPALRRDQEELLEFGYDVRDLPGDFKLGLDWSQATTGAMVAVDGPSGFGIG
jgi:hypothetical protein